jgi:hypothetical protein
MSIRACVALAAVWLLSLVAVAAAASAQVKEYRRLPEPRVISGADFGFRVEGMYGDVPTGTIVIRVNNEWVEARVGEPTYVR